MFKLENVKVNRIIKIEKLIINDRSTTCIVGQSGSGKTTLLRLLNNLDSPDEGKIFYGGELLSELDPVSLRRKITMVPQTPVIFDGTIKDNLVIGQHFYGQEPAANKVLHDVLNIMLLDKELNGDAADLSGGEKQRLTLARALLLDAEVYLLDEPSSALDDTTAKKVLQSFVTQLEEKGKTTIMITHNREISNLFADDMICMDDYSLASAKKAGV